MWAADGVAECGGVRGQRDLSASEGFCCFQKQATMTFFFLVIIYCNSGHAHTPETVGPQILLCSPPSLG